MTAIRNLSVIHRWLGVVLCLFFTAWFASGIVLIYVPFPALSKADQLSARSEVNVAGVNVAPAAVIKAASVLSPYDRIQLVARGQRPLYILHPRGKAAVAIWADNGEDASVQSAQVAGSIAASFAGSPPRSVKGPFDLDQWTVHESFDSLRPYYRVSLDDESGTELYVSQASGEVVQRTRRWERTWNYFGAVLHWIYPTVLRRHWAVWDQVVWWLSLAGIILTVFGIWLGVVRSSRALRGGRGKISLFRGWMRWHHILGLFAGVFVLTWIVSGWLSMDHGRLLSVPNPTQIASDEFRGMGLAEAARQSDLELIRSLPSFRQMDIQAVGGIPFVVIRSPEKSQIHSVTSKEWQGVAELPRSTIDDAAQSAWPADAIFSTARVAADDVYVQLRNSGLPPSAVRIKLGAKGSTWAHVDSSTGEILSVMDRSRRVNRWLFNGLHSLDFPGLVERRPLWDIVIVSLLLLGLAFSLSGVYLGAKRLRRASR